MNGPIFSGVSGGHWAAFAVREKSVGSPILSYVYLLLAKVCSAAFFELFIR
jgi:hypothetical protein